MRMCFCFVLLSLALFYLSPVMFLSAATCITLSSYFCRYFIIFLFYFFITHPRMCASALMQTHTCVGVFIIIIILVPILPTSAYAVFYFLTESRFTHTHLRICIRANTHMRMFPYFFPVIGERVLPHVDPVVFILSYVPIFPPCF